MFDLDIRTLLVVTALASIGSAVALVFLWLSQYRRNGSGFWAVGMSCVATASILISGRGTLPDSISLVLANSLYVLGFVLILRGVRVFAHRPPLFLVDFALPPIAAMLFYYFNFVEQNINIRIAVLSVAFMLTCLAIVITLLRDKKAPWRFAGFSVAIVFGLFGIFHTIRGVIALTFPIEQFLMYSSMSSSLVFLAGIFILGGSPITLILLTYAALESELRIVSLTVNQSASSIIITDTDGSIEYVNPSFTDNTGYLPEELIGKNPRILRSSDTKLEEYTALWKALSAGNTWRGEFQNRKKNGELFWEIASIAPVKQRNGNISHYVAIKEDITALKSAEEKLKLAASVFSHAREGIIITDNRATIIDVNSAFTLITGFSREEVIGKNPSILQSGRQSGEFYNDMWQALLKDGYWSGEVWNRRKNGEVYAVMKTISAVHDENGIITHYVSLGNDITQIKEHQEQLERIAHYDLLTSLPNRVLLADRLSQAMMQCSRHEKSLAVVFLDLDGFKKVNDTHSHNVGDELLISVSIRMKEALREGDTLARIGGDEFVAVLTNLNTVKDCEPVLERLLLAASEPVTISDIVLNISASIGVTLYPQDSVDADQLMRHADQAMYEAKQSGKNRYHLFNTAQDNAVKVQRESLDAIRSALDNHQFVLHYQPKINMRTGRVIGAEALIRWQHPKKGLLNPIEFLPVIENNPMSIEMGEWVIDTALTQISHWQAMGLKLPVSTSVNIAAVQLQQPDFTQRLTTLLAAHPDVEPRYLELEVLETSALDDVHHVSTIMTDCMALGVKFALDDFGTGYSSLTYLRRLPASLIKIDQTFVRDMLDDPNDLAIVEGVIALAKSFKRDVIAEGVETIEHGTALLELGCDLAQGYGIAKPMPGSDIPAWVAEWKPDVSWQI
jgi:diguanylate cyclase (GGDEF)-like protein/PAS domain S-box-containing protein